MDLLRLHLRNFTSYSDVDVNLEHLHVVGLLGPNGSGKSSFIEAITWALYGMSSKGGRKEADNYVRVGENECQVVLDFLLGNTYRVERTWNKAQRRGRLVLYLLKDSEWIPQCKTAAETQEAIEKLLRMDYRTFTSTVISLQGQIGNFTSCTDQERKEILSSILGLDIWERMQNDIADALKSLDRDYQISSDELLRLESTLKEESIANSRLSEKTRMLEEVKNTCVYYEEQISVLTQEVSSLEASGQILADSKSKIEQVKEDYHKRRDDFERQISIIQSTIDWSNQQIEKINSRLERARSIVNNKQAIESGYTERLSIESRLASLGFLRQEFLSLVEEIDTVRSLEENIERIRNSVSLLDRVPCDREFQASCPLLSTALEELNQLRALLELKGERSSEELNKRRAALEVDINELESLQKRLAHLPTATDRDSMLQAELDIAECLSNLEQCSDHKESAIAELQKIYNQLDDEHKALERTVAELERQADELYVEYRRLDSKKQILERVKNSLLLERSRVEKLHQEVGALQQRMFDIKAAKALWKDKRLDLSIIQHKIVLHELLSRAMSKKRGVPALIVENAIPEITSLANQILERVTHGRFQINLETQVESKTTDTVQEVLKIFVMDDGVERPYQTFSGAQKFILDLSLRVAISKFLAHRSGTEIKILVIDEGFGALDDANLENIMDSIFEIAADFNKVFIVTHLLRLKDLMPQKIYFRESLDGTEIDVVS